MSSGFALHMPYVFIDCISEWKRYRSTCCNLCRVIPEKPSNNLHTWHGLTWVSLKLLRRCLSLQRKWGVIFLRQQLARDLWLYTAGKPSSFRRQLLCAWQNINTCITPPLWILLYVFLQTSNLFFSKFISNGNLDSCIRFI